MHLILVQEKKQLKEHKIINKIKILKYMNNLIN